MLSLKNAENDLQPYLYRQRDNISLGVFGSYLILPIFKRFMEKHPDVSLHVKEYSSEKTIKKLCDSSVDVGIVYQCDLPSHLATTVLFEDEIILAVPLTHPLAKFDTIKPEHLNGMSVIILNDMLLLRKVIVSELEKNKIIPNIICELDNHYSCLEYAEAQIGIAFVTRSLFGSLVPKNVRLVSLDIPAFFRPVMLVHNRELLLDEPTCALITQIKNFYTTEMQSSLRKDVVCA